MEKSLVEEDVAFSETEYNVKRGVPDEDEIKNALSWWSGYKSRRNGKVISI